MRGLKLQRSVSWPWTVVASFTDAWIETTREGLPTQNQYVASFTDAWIETYRRIYRRQVGIVASFTDAWIETGLQENYYKGGKSHLLQMRGLKPSEERQHEI